MGAPVNDPVEQKPSLPREVAGTLGAWITGQIKVAAILALVYSAGFAAARVPWWFVIGPICGALNLLPVLGSVLALGLAAAVGYFGTNNVYVALGALVTYVIAQTLEGFYLTPRIMGRRLRLPPVMVFVAVLVGGALFGVVGVLFAAPALAIAAVIWRRTRSAR